MTEKCSVPEFLGRGDRPSGSPLVVLHETLYIVQSNWHSLPTLAIVQVVVNAVVVVC